jgi:hypothetical protein
LNHQGGAPLYDRSGYSVLCEAPTGGGKTAGTIIPAVLEWPGSLVVVDVKGEIFEKTSGYLASRGVDVVCLDPDAPVHGYNPLATVRRDSHVEIDARNSVVPDRESGFEHLDLCKPGTLAERRQWTDRRPLVRKCLTGKGSLCES